MNAETTIPETTEESPLRSALRWGAAGLLMGAAAAAVGLLWHRGDARAVALPLFLVVYPSVGAILGWLRTRHPSMGKRPPGFFAEEPMSDEEFRERRKRLQRPVWTGFACGLVVAMVNSALDFAWRGWPDLGGSLQFGLQFFPAFGAMLGLNLGMRPGDPRPSRRDLRISMQTLMILIAYLAFCLALFSQFGRLIQTAKTARSQAASHQTTAGVFQKILDDARRDQKRTENAQALREGRIPDGILPSQREFLRSLDGTATDEYKKYRYTLIADGEDRLARIADGNAEIYSRIVDHYRSLAAKYNAAAQRPWLPVAPDPPMPQ